MKKRIILLLTLIIMTFSLFADAVKTEGRGLSFALTKEFTNPVLVRFADNNSTEENLNVISVCELNLENPGERVYYLVISAKPQYSDYSVKVTVSPFLMNGKYLPAAVSVRSTKQGIDISKPIGEEVAEINLNGKYGPKEVDGSYDDCFFEFYYDFGNAAITAAPGIYNSTVTVEVSKDA